MDLEVVGRHALLFDDDAMLAFVNSGDALVEWNSLEIDRYDVRHLLSSPPPSRRRGGYPPPSTSNSSEKSLEDELDYQRYLDLPPPSDEPEMEEGEEKSVDASGYRAVAFSYENAHEHADGRNVDEGPEHTLFRPSFPVPESLRESLPPSDKVHQIIARTAMFVSKHGGQSEIVLRVKQGDNPTFGFLMPDHHLHPYFRFLVDHQDLLQSEVDGNLQSEESRANNVNSKSVSVGGALSLLGSAYDSGEDEDGATEGNPDSDRTQSGKKVNAVNSVVSQGVDRSESSISTGDKDGPVSKHPIPPSQKEKTSAIKKNPSINAFTARIANAMKKEDGPSTLSATVEKLKGPKEDPLIVEPPSDIKRMIDKIVDFIVKNGEQFEATLIEQDNKHGRFPFLLPSSQYHPYYLKVLQKSQEKKLSGRNFPSGKDDAGSLVLGKKPSQPRENNSFSFQSAGESERKEKFKMVIGKSKDGQDPSSKITPHEVGVTVDAVAAILQAAARGIKNPDIGLISSSTLNRILNGQSSEGGQSASIGTHSQPNNSMPKSDQDGEHKTSIHVAEIAKSAALQAAGEADSSEAHLTKEQKLKAERLKRAKMFVAMLKRGPPVTNDQSQETVMELQASAVLGLGTEVNLACKEREGSSAPPDVDISDKNEVSEAKLFNDEYNERRSKRKYRSRPGRHDEDEDEEEEAEEEEEEEEQKRKKKSSRKKHRSSRKDEEEVSESEKDRDYRHSKRKKHRSHRSSYLESDNEDVEDEMDHKRSGKRRRSRHSSLESNDCKEDESRSHHKSSRKKHSSRHCSRGEDNYNSDERDKKSSRKKHGSHRSSHRSRDGHRHRERHTSRDRESLEEERKHDKSLDDKHEDSNNVEHRKESSEELEEGEIVSKFADQSQRGGDGHEASLDVRAPLQPSEPANNVSDDLRAKIRAMLMATR